MEQEDTNKPPPNPKNLGSSSRTCIGENEESGNDWSKPYLQVLIGKTTKLLDVTPATPPPPPSRIARWMCSRFIEVETMHWLETNLVGVCRKDYEPEKVKSMIHEHERDDVSIKRVVGHHFLITYVNSE